MAKKQKRNNRGIITVGGNLTLPGQKGPNVIVLTQPKRFGIDIADYMTAIRAAENVDYSRRYKLYDLYADILMDTHLTCVIEKRKNAVLCSDIEFRRNGKPDDAVNEPNSFPVVQPAGRRHHRCQVLGLLPLPVLPGGGMGGLRLDTP